MIMIIIIIFIIIIIIITIITKLCRFYTPENCHKYLI